MSFVKIQPEDGAKITIKPNGKIVFSDASMIMLIPVMDKPPYRLAIFYDEANNQLGFRQKHAADLEDLTGFLILLHESPGEFKIDASDHLDVYDLAPESNLNLDLNEPVEVGEGEIDHGVYWVQLP